MLVYGPSAHGALRAFAAQRGAQTLNDLSKPPHLNWVEFSLQTLDIAAASGDLVLFDMTNIEDIGGVLGNTGRYAQTVTAIELRYIRDPWSRFGGCVQFCENGFVRGVPWQLN